MENKFIGDCRYLLEEELHTMLDNAEEVGYTELEGVVGREELTKAFPIYDWDDVDGMHLCNDYAVSFCKSMYAGEPVYYVRWSSIEFVWRA